MADEGIKAVRTEERNSELKTKAGEIADFLAREFDVAAFVAGSLATGLNIPGDRDFDFVLSEGDVARFKQLWRELSKTFLEEPVFPEDCDMHVFRGEVLGEGVHVALMVPPKANLIKYALGRVNANLTAAEKEMIVRKKMRMKKVWFFRRHRYNKYKKKLNRSLGIPRFKRQPLLDGNSARVG